MRLVVLTAVRLLGDGLVACMAARSGIQDVGVVADLRQLRERVAAGGVDLVLIDVTQGVDLYDVRSVAAQHPDVALVALGLTEQRQEVIRCGRAGFTGYVSREATTDERCAALTDVIEGRLACPAEISGGLLRALFRRDDDAHPAAEPALTAREGHVLQLIGE